MAMKIEMKITACRSQLTWRCCHDRIRSAKWAMLFTSALELHDTSNAEHMLAGKADRPKCNRKTDGAKIVG